MAVACFQACSLTVVNRRLRGGQLHLRYIRGVRDNAVESTVYVGVCQLVVV